MPLAKRIIPTILHRNGSLVKGKRFINDRVIGVALQSARIHAARGVDELMILDVSATEEGREPNYFLIKSLANNCFSPITVGGGISKIEHVRKLLQNGADKVCIGTNKSLIQEISDRYGKSTVVASLDVSSKTSIKEAQDEAWLLENDGAGEILLQYVPRDGTMKGYNLPLIKAVSETVSIPVIASSGCKNYLNMVHAIRYGAAAVAAGALFAFTDCTPKGAAEYMDKSGITVRL